jgi:NADPH2:quinone reductase
MLTHSVLIHGGAGGVGIAALQLCKWAGIEKVWATSSAPKHEIIKQYGARAIDRHNENFVDIIRKETNGRGVDHVLDPIGGEHLKRSLSVVAEGGRLYTYGLSAAAPTSKTFPSQGTFCDEKNTKIRPSTAHDAKPFCIWGTHGYMER